jgi:hypothetical protein
MAVAFSQQRRVRMGENDHARLGLESTLNSPRRPRKGGAGAIEDLFSSKEP